MPGCGAGKKKNPEVKYETQGPQGKQCRDCKFFEGISDPSQGKCFGKTVLIEGTCNMFAPK